MMTSFLLSYSKSRIIIQRSDYIRHFSSRLLRPFQIEQYEGWLAKDGLSDSDSEPLSMKTLLDMADDETMDMWNELSLGYPLHVQGDPLLRSQIASEFYPTLDYDSIDRINCLAPQEGIFCAMHAILKPGDDVIVTAPSYQSLSEIPRSIGCTVHHWLPDLVQETEGSSGQDPYFRFDPSTLRKMLEQIPSTKLIVVNFPHNPTGALPTLDEWQEIVESCRVNGSYLFCDEMYRMLEHEGVDRLDPIVETYELGISLSGLSKAFGLAGLRMGWVVSPDLTLSKRIQQIKDYTTICSPGPSQVLSLIALRNSQTLIRRCSQIIHDVRSQVHIFCNDNKDVLEWTRPRAGSFVFPKLITQHRQGARVYCDHLLSRADIMLLPSSLFEYGEHKKDDTRVRISIGRLSIPKTLGSWKEHGF